MRPHAWSPAKRLNSASGRYRPLTLPWFVVARPEHSWWDFQSARDAAATETDRERRVQHVEAVLFLAREPLNSRKLAQFSHLADGTEARTLVRRLNQVYDESGRAFRVEEVAGGFRLMSRRQFAPWLRRLEHVPAETRLSAPSLETLAVVAYRQPVLRADIEAIRGVSCGEILRQLMDKDLVRIGGRSEELGRPYLYMTTKRFLQLFGLQNLDQLPRAGVLRQGESSADTVPVSGAESGFSDDHQQEEGSEVRVTSTKLLSADEPIDEVTLVTAAGLQLSQDEDDELEDEDYDDDDELDDDEDELDEDDDDDYEDDDYDDDDDEDDEDEFEEVDEDDDDEFEEVDDEDDEDDDFDDELDDDEWEEVEDDDVEDEEDWEDDEEDWEDDEEEEEDED